MDNTRSDALGFTEPSEKKGDKGNETQPNLAEKKPPETQENILEQEFDEVMETGNKANAFMDTPAFRELTSQGLQHFTAATNPAGRPKNQFNIIGGTIGQAAIGNTGSVVFNQKQNVYESGSSQSKFDISGGNFAQANIGGKAAYNNKDTKFETGGDGGAGGKMFFTAEEYTLHILEKGVTLKQLQNLLELGYTLANIALALPKNPNLRNKMIHAMMVDQ